MDRGCLTASRTVIVPGLLEVLADLRVEYADQRRARALVFLRHGHASRLLHRAGG